MQNIILSLIFWTILTNVCFAQTAVSPLISQAPIPQLAEWENQMLVKGRQNCTRLQNYSGFDQFGNPNGLIDTYYDAEDVYLRLAAYTADTSWLPCAEAAKGIYRDRYVLDSSTGQNCNGGYCPGYWNFTDGLRRDFSRTGNLTSKQAVILLSRNAAFARDNTPEDTSRAQYAREVSYAILSYLNAEEVGEARRSRLDILVNQSLGHFDQWFAPTSEIDTKPFMVGLSAQALIRYFEKTGDPRVLPKIRLAADSLWNDYWVTESESFIYEKYFSNVPGEGRTPAPDLNLLIAPLYAWLYHQTGEANYQIRGDAVFAGGVRLAYLDGGKQFDQNYRWSNEYVVWRTAPPISSRSNQVGDFDGDGRMDLSVFRPNTGNWYFLQSSNQQFRSQHFGTSGDFPAAGDFDGDGKSDLAVFRLSNGSWYVLESQSNTFRTVLFGQTGDVPLVGDYDGDGKTDYTVFRPGAGIWYSLRSSDAEVRGQLFGLSTDIAVPGDFDGDGKADVTVFRPSNGFWYIWQSATNRLRSEQFGQSGDKLTPSDFDGDGITDLAVFRNGNWYIKQSLNQQFKGVQFGLGSDVPVVGDYDGDGIADPAVFRNGNWYILQSMSNSFRSQNFGVSSDIPIPGLMGSTN